MKLAISFCCIWIPPLVVLDLLANEERLLCLLEIKKWYFAVWMEHELKMILCQRSLQSGGELRLVQPNSVAYMDLLLVKMKSLIARTSYHHRTLEAAREFEERKDAWLGQTLKRKRHRTFANKWWIFIPITMDRTAIFFHPSTMGHNPVPWPFWQREVGYCLR